jgi:ferric-dicitrate binding protein FerR (iron transport regulator)
MDYQKLVDELFTKQPHERSFAVMSGEKNALQSDEQIKKEVWDTIQSRIASKNRTENRSWFISGVAASISLFIVFTSILFFQFGHSTISLNTTTGSTLSYKIMDGADVTFNAMSTVRLGKPFSSYNRSASAFFEGEALFQLHGVNIEIPLSDNLKISSLDGKFNLFNRGGNVIISSLDAFVSVLFNGSLRVLSPGQNVFFNTADTALANFGLTPVKNFASWVRGEFFFENNTLDFVLSEFTRQFGVSVNTNLLGKYKLAESHFKRSDGWEISLASILGESGLIYVFHPEANQIEIRRGLI